MTDDPFTLLIESHYLKEKKILGTISDEDYEKELDALLESAKALESAALIN